MNLSDFDSHYTLRFKLNLTFLDMNISTYWNRSRYNRVSQNWVTYLGQRNIRWSKR
jgi:hypothetical protein